MSNQATTREITISLDTIANSMQMKKDEVRFFPHFPEIRQILSDYSFDCSTVEETVKRLQGVKEKCFGMEVYKRAIDNLCGNLLQRVM